MASSPGSDISASSDAVRARPLSSLGWSLSGYWPTAWRAKSMELGLSIEPEIAEVPVKFPGSVQNALREAGVIADWNVGLNSRACEWVENRDWVYSTEIPDAWIEPEARHHVEFEGLDGPGCVVLNGVEIARFDNAFIAHRVEVTPFLQPSGNRLEVVFFPPPRWLGQIGFTSKIEGWKIRFNYGWDWVPRLVQIGPWEPASWRTVKQNGFEDFRCRTTWDARKKRGAIYLSANVLGPEAEALTIRVRLFDASQTLVDTLQLRVGELEQGKTWVLENLRPWFPNGAGVQDLYLLEVDLLDAEGGRVDAVRRHVGFKEISWSSCRNSPPEAPPWLCAVNGKQVFLQGVNWTPIRPNFADLTREDYERLLCRYAEMGGNLLRVWGGGFLEKEWFYELCDQLGLMVWQEFPLSSSGLDNWPPEDEPSMETLVDIARTYITRRQHHASLLLWCGGNELQGGQDGSKMGIGRPIGDEHPLMRRWAALVEAEDPGRRFVPTSAFGPTFMAEVKDFGKGRHWDVHGPWKAPGGTAESSRDYWLQDDALLRSEVGAPGASSAELIRRYSGGLAVLPASLENELWRRFTWWLEWEDYRQESEVSERDLHQYVAWSQQRQTRALAQAVAASKQRYPEIGGIMLWMGHDCFPCPINTSIIDFEGNAKPAAAVVAQIWKMAPEEVINSSVWKTYFEAT